MAKLGSMELDVVDSERPQFSNLVTDKPVESGVDIADHIEQKPVNLNLKCYFAVNEQDKYKQLKKMRNSQNLFTYEGNFETFENMAIQQLSALKNSDLGNGFECDILLKQVRVVEQETTEINLGKDPVTGQQAQADPKETKKKESKEEEVNNSTLYKAYNFLRGDDND